MELGLLSWIVLTGVALPGNTSPMPDQYTRGVDWLSRYGYLPPPDPHTGKLQTKEGIERAIRVMQRFGGIRETGVLDSETLKLMSTPRCSLPDIVGSEDMLRRRRRRKRYSLTGLQWEKTDLTWSVHSYPSESLSSSLNPSTVDSLLAHAFKAWSDVSPLHFQRLQSDSEGDILVSFTRSLHDDGYPFDGRGGTLAHAFFPSRAQIAGDTHFDDDEIWSYGGEGSSTDLFTVAVHEFGHALGLSHSSSDPSIMKPYYQGPVGDIANYRLPQDDRQAIQQLYGVKEGRPSPPVGDPDLPHLPSPAPPRPTPHADPSFLDRCEGGFDAVANIRGEVFFFKGVYFWRTKRDGSLISLHPALIKNFWIGLPPGTNKIDAVYERKSDSCIIFFIGSQYWVFKDTVAMEGYPRPLADWGLQTGGGKPVDRVDAAFIWAHNGKLYLFSGGKFWRFDDSQAGKQVPKQPEAGYPRNSTLWKGVPAHPDDIISWGEGDAYFFKNNLFWVLKRGGMDQDNVTPKSIAVDWLQCPAPAPTRSPAAPKPRDCSCALNRSSAFPKSSVLLLLAVVLISSVLTRK
ncbi:matrix metalloproteinase-25 [Lampris incognitus]|uniref:matrix metalloproteinase-25 n=1 Tax=Lampris incognitus TaxID=2546036 RepID=UPI0024B4EC17|nr:matrix metalloproteinase-25 [Lampris incognitus]